MPYAVIYSIILCVSLNYIAHLLLKNVKRYETDSVNILVDHGYHKSHVFAVFILLFFIP